MLAAIKSSGAITLQAFEEAINYENWQGTMAPIEGTASYLLQSTVITQFKTTEKLLVVGCATCNNNEGEIRIYNPASMKIIKGYVGSSKHAFMGKRISVTPQTDGAAMIWYSTRSGSTMGMSAIVTFQNYETERFEFE